MSPGQTTAPLGSSRTPVGRSLSSSISPTISSRMSSTVTMPEEHAVLVEHGAVEACASRNRPSSTSSVCRSGVICISRTWSAAGAEAPPASNACERSRASTTPQAARRRRRASGKPRVAAGHAPPSSASADRPPARARPITRERGVSTSDARRSSSVKNAPQAPGRRRDRPGPSAVRPPIRVSQLLERSRPPWLGRRPGRRTHGRWRSRSRSAGATSGRRAAVEDLQRPRPPAPTTRSADPIAKLFGACSPMVMCSAVMISSAPMVAITATASAASRLPNAGSIRFAIVGSPIAPRASEAIVIPSWQAARYSSSDPSAGAPAGARRSQGRSSARARATPARTRPRRRNR